MFGAEVAGEVELGVKVGSVAAGELDAGIEEVAAGGEEDIGVV